MSITSAVDTTLLNKLRDQIQLFIVTYFMLFTVANSFFGLLHLVNVNDVVDVSEIYAISNFRVEVCMVGEFMYT
jgi:hypothetical protein